LRRGQPIASLGAAGGPTIISQTVVNIINLLDYQMPLDQALSSPRLHHQWKPDELRVEPLPADIQEKLKARGHTLITVRRAGAAQAVLKIGDHFEAAHDPRLEGKAAGW